VLSYTIACLISNKC